MKMVVFGLAISSSWGNGHATLWRGLVAALAKRGWTVVFFEKDVSWYADHRDTTAVPGGELVLYPAFEEVRALARRHVAEADAVVVTSYCPDGRIASALCADAPRAVKVFYGLDTPVTLARVNAGEALPEMGPRGLADFDLALSFTGGAALQALVSRLKAPRALPLYGHADPAVHRPAAADAAFAGDLSYIGTYAADRQASLDALFVQAARRAPERRFVLAGSQYPADFPWTDNVFFVRHLTPDAHPAFHAASRLTLNVTRAAMARNGWCPSGRLFEAAACGTPILTDRWPGLESFFTPGEEILTAADADDTLEALSRSPDALAAIAGRARERLLAEHTSAHRAAEMEAALQACREPAL